MTLCDAGNITLGAGCAGACVSRMQNLQARIGDVVVGTPYLYVGTSLLICRWSLVDVLRLLLHMLSIRFFLVKGFKHHGA